MAATDLFSGTDRHAQYNAGRRIFGRGQCAPLMDVILEGAVGVGGVFGAMALIDDEPQGKTRVAKIDRDSSLARVQRSPEFALAGTF
jgi:hypothetical protein